MENLAVKELERGREFAKQLRRLMVRPVDDEGGDDKVKAFTTSSAEDLAAKVFDSFTNALSLFNHHHHHHRHVSADSSIITSSFSHLPATSDESHEIPKTKSPTITIKDRTRSSPKKRKGIQAWVVESKTSPKEDGHAWRKYGQKVILNSKHTRSYFRCTHKHDQGCEATKQVQQIQENPPLYRTTYFGLHTCTKDLLNPHLILDDSHDLNSTSALILRFDKVDNNLNTTFDQNVNNNKINGSFSSAQKNHNLFLSPNSALFTSSGSVVENEEKHCDSIMVKQEKNTINVAAAASCSSSINDCLVHHHHHEEEEAVLPPFGGGGDQVDLFNSPLFHDPLFFEDPFFQIF